MKFKIAARVISHLGQELISSDEIAIYELVKNGFDAGSKLVKVNINYRLDVDFIEELQQELLDLFFMGQGQDAVPNKISSRIIREIEKLKTREKNSLFCLLDEIEIDKYITRLNRSQNIEGYIKNLGRINSIEVIDTGTGMTKENVENAFLTIGTKHRYNQVRRIENGFSKDEVSTGEKGIGRLSAMRLGHFLDLSTLANNSTSRINLHINWRYFCANFDNQVTDIELRHKELVDDTGNHGTKIVISGLSAPWTREKVDFLVHYQLSKFLNPFRENVKKVRVYYNGDLQEVGKLDRIFIDNCVNYFKFNVSFNEQNRAIIDTKFKIADHKYSREYTTLDFEGITDAELRAVGPFDVELYHYPRNKITAIPGVATVREFKQKLVRSLVWWVNDIS